MSKFGDKVAVVLIEAKVLEKVLLFSWGVKIISKSTNQIFDEVFGHLVPFVFLNLNDGCLLSVRLFPLSLLEGVHL